MLNIIFPKPVNFTYQQQHPTVDYVHGDRLILGVGP
jgi:hypothetical protein